MSIQLLTVIIQFLKVHLVNNEDGNVVFDGIRVFVQEDVLGINQEESKFITNNNITILDKAIFPPVLGGQ